MRCEVLLFAQLRDALDATHLNVELPDHTTVGSALDILSARHPEIAELRDRIAVAIDEQYARADAKLTDGCRLALIPPVSGG
ncbi:MAG: molybdopterin converting factor subunit 1 [Planctomycetes bacterium]|nr:molybdopterin converting factor subunit 1 [Planctomycetota bacterium]